MVKPDDPKQIVRQTTWHNRNALTLENDTLKVVVVPEMGAKIVSLFDKLNQVEWLAGPGKRPFTPVPYGSVFTDQDMSGWDEMFPTIVACKYPASGLERSADLPDHGEVWTLPWKQTGAGESDISLQVEGRALPYLFSRQINFLKTSVLRFTYQVVNLSDSSIHVMWAAHPQFSAGKQARIILPPQITEVWNVLPDSFGWGSPETRVSWPRAKQDGGDVVLLDHVGPADQKQARKFYALPETKVGWVGLIQQPTNNWVAMAWDSDKVPYFGLWIDEGYHSSESVVTPEPSTGFYDCLSLAWNNGRVMTIEPGKTISWTLTVSFGGNQDPFPYNRTSLIG